MIGQEHADNIYYEVIFDQVHANNFPRIQEADESYSPIFPHEARIRNLTYTTEIYVDVKLQKLQQIIDKSPLQTSEKREAKFKVLNDYENGTKRVFLAKVPVMVRSNFCHLRNLNENEIIKDGKECTFDQGGYFVINGSEKVIIAHERMANNIVLVFHRKPPSKYSWVAEIRSQGENSNKPPQ